MLVILDVNMPLSRMWPSIILAHNNLTRFYLNLLIPHLGQTLRQAQWQACDFRKIAIAVYMIRYHIDKTKVKNFLSAKYRLHRSETSERTAHSLRWTRCSGNSQSIHSEFSLQWQKFVCVHKVFLIGHVFVYLIHPNHTKPLFSLSKLLNILLSGLVLHGTWWSEKGVFCAR